MAEPINKFSEKEILQRLKKYPEWDYDDHVVKLIGEKEFKNFLLAIEFVNKLAKLAEKLGHHPDLYVHDYKFVTILTSTHSVDGITESDFELIREVEKL